MWSSEDSGGVLGSHLGDLGDVGTTTLAALLEGTGSTISKGVGFTVDAALAGWSAPGRGRLSVGHCYLGTPQSRNPPGAQTESEGKERREDGIYPDCCTDWISSRKTECGGRWYDDHHCQATVYHSRSSSVWSWDARVMKAKLMPAMPVARKTVRCQLLQLPAGTSLDSATIWYTQGFSVVGSAGASGTK